MEKKKSAKKSAKSTSKPKNKLKKKSMPQKSLSEKLTEASADLFYISETDAPFEVFVWKLELGREAFSEVNAANVLRLSGNALEAPVHEQTIEDFFRNLTTEQDWHTEEDKQIVRRFIRLKELIEKELKGAKVFKVGEVELDVYIVGIDANGNLAGLKTKAVET